MNLRERFSKSFIIGVGLALGLGFTAVIAVTVTGTVNSFTSGQQLESAKMNENFTSLKTAIEGITSSQWTNGSGKIYYNGGNVGIGTASPVATFNVSSLPAAGTTNSYFTTSDFVDGSVGSAFRISFGAATGNTYTALSAFQSGAASWNNLILQPGGGNVRWTKPRPPLFGETRNSSPQP